MSRGKLPEGYQGYEVLVEKFKEEYGKEGLIKVNAANTAAGESVLTTLRVEVLNGEQVIATSVVNCIDADSDDSSKAESKAIRRALCRLPGFMSVDPDSEVSEEDDEEETRSSRRKKKTSRRAKGRTVRAAEESDEESEEEDEDEAPRSRGKSRRVAAEAEESDDGEEEEEDAPKSRTRSKARSQELLKKYGRRG